MYFINLQRFAEEGENLEQNQNESTKEEKNEEVKESKAKYTDEDLDRIINKKS